MTADYTHGAGAALPRDLVLPLCHEVIDGRTCLEPQRPDRGAWVRCSAGHEVRDSEACEDAEREADVMERRAMAES